MANSLLSSLTSALDSQSIEGVAACLGAPAHAISQGFQGSIASILGSLASKAEDAQDLRRILDLNPPALAGTKFSDVATAVSDPVSPLISGGERLLAGLFGNSETAVTDAISSSAGLRHGTASTILSLTAPWVLGFINQRVHAEGLSMTGLGNILQNETPAIRNSLPGGVGGLLWPLPAQTGPGAIEQPVLAQPSALRWILPLLALAALVPAIAWMINHSPTVRPSQTSQVRPRLGGFGRASRLASDASRSVNNSVDIVRGVLAKNVLSFKTGSSELLRESEARLNQIASTLQAYPDLHATISGYTDDSGSAEKNITLSRGRAESVRAALVRKGISSDRLSADGYGQEDPIADNSTAQGRAENRRVTVNVSEP